MMLIPWEEAGYYRDWHGVKRLGPGVRGMVSVVGPDAAPKFSGKRGINFHEGSMRLRHGAGSRYAENLRKRSNGE